MPKRPYPFEYNCLPQLKVHVGQKEFDLKHEDSMMKIHDKTLHLLFNGAKDLYKVNGNAMKNKSAVNKAGFESKCSSKNVSEYCSLCKDLNVAETKCSFCDKWICQMCSAACYICSQTFCVTHSLKLYDQNDDCVCLNCEKYCVN